jgi:Aldo/keto reductase family
MSNLIDRRTLIQATGASVVAGSVKVAQAAPTTGQSGIATDDLIVRKIPKGEDVLPAIGLGTFITFDLVPGARRDHLLEVTRRFWAAGGRVFDTSPLYGMAQVNVGQFASVLGINDKMFVSNKVWATGAYLADDRQAQDSLRLSRERLWRDKIDLMLCHSLVNVDIMVPLMHAWKKAGRIRFLGVTHYELPYFEANGSRRAMLMSSRCTIRSRPGRQRSASSPPRPTVAWQSRSTCRSRRRGCTSSSRVVRCRTSPRSLAPRLGRPSS